MTLLKKWGGIDYMEYCYNTKKFLDEIDNSLWVRFTQVNPYSFYRLDEDRQIGRIARSIEKVRENEKVIEEIGPLDRVDMDRMKKEAAYIKLANEPYKDE